MCANTHSEWLRGLESISLKTTNDWLGQAATHTESSMGSAEREKNTELELIVRRIAEADVVALAMLFDRTVIFIRSIALSRLRSREDAEEVALDVLSHVWRHASLYDPQRGTVIAWLSVMARNKSIDRLRRRKVTVRLEDVSSFLSCESLGPEEQAVKSSSAHTLQVGVAALAPMRCRVLSLAFLEEQTHEEIARVTLLPMGSVKSHVRRALITLRRQLASEDLS